jgi:hypothetical protein
MHFRVLLADVFIVWLFVVLRETVGHILKETGMIGVGEKTGSDT